MKKTRPRVILICCEGKETERLYFNIIKNIYRIPRGSVSVKILGGKGQHRKLVDSSRAERENLAKKLDLHPSAIETWAVCDKDSREDIYRDLDKYANKYNIKLAFSSPSIEIHLRQYFGFSASNKSSSQLENELSKLTGVKYKKSDLSWLQDTLYKNPKLILSAIKNSRLISDPDKTPFTNTHTLVERLLEFASIPK